MKKIIAFLTFVLLCMSLVGCDIQLNEGQEAGTYVAPQSVAPVPEIINGAAFDGTLRDSTINVYQLDSEGKAGASLGTTTTDTEGNYSVDVLGAVDGYILITATDGYYYEEANPKQRVNLGKDDILTAIVSYQKGNAVDALVTPLTHYAAAVVLYSLEKRNMTIGSAVDQAGQDITAHFGFHIYTQKPIDLIAQGDKVSDLNDGAQYGFVFAGVSQLMKDIGGDNAVFNSLYFHDRLYQDVRYDGVFDGKGSNGDIYIGKYQVTVNSLRNDLPKAMLGYLRSPENKTKVTPRSIIAYGEQLASSSGRIFDYANIKRFDEEAPTVTVVNPEKVQTGIFQFCAVVKDNMLLKSASVEVVELRKDPNRWAVVNEVVLTKSPVAYDASGKGCVEINSLSTIEDTLKATFTVVDFANNVTTKDHIIKISNTKPFMNIDGLESVVFMNGHKDFPDRVGYASTDKAFTLKGSAGVGSYTSLESLHLCRGADALAIYKTADKCVELTTNLSKGSYSFSFDIGVGIKIEAKKYFSITGINNYILQACDVVGNCRQEEFVIVADDEEPDVYWSSDRSSRGFSAYDSVTKIVTPEPNIQAVLVREQGKDIVTKTVSFGVGNVSLNGLQVDKAVLNENKIFFFGYGVGDTYQKGFTNADELKIDYSYSVRLESKPTDTVVFDFKPIPLYQSLGENSARILIPVVEEWLGTDWYKRPLGTKHIISIRAIDKAGNVKVQSFIFSSHFELNLKPIVESNNKAGIDYLNSLSFSSRGSLNGSKIKPRTFTFKNTSGSELLLDPALTVATLLYVTNERKRYRRQIKKAVLSHNGDHYAQGTYPRDWRTKCLIPLSFHWGAWNTKLIITSYDHKFFFSPNEPITRPVLPIPISSNGGMLCGIHGPNNNDREHAISRYISGGDIHALHNTTRLFYYQSSAGYYSDRITEMRAATVTAAFEVKDQHGNSLFRGANGYTVANGSEVTITPVFAFPSFAYHNDTEVIYTPSGVRYGTFLFNKSIVLSVHGQAHFKIRHPDIDSYDQSLPMNYNYRLMRY